MNDKLKASKSSPYFANLDGLRFFCFLSVFFFHSFHTEDNKILQSRFFRFIKDDLFSNGFLGVNFFFVLSGFLITYLLIVEKQQNSQIHIGKFWIRRILRIWPLYFLCVFYGFVIFPILKQVSGGVPSESADYRFYLTFLSNFDHIKKGLPDAHGLGVLWSVAIEEQFYLAWPLILFLFPIKRFWIPLLIILSSSVTFRYLNDNPKLHEMHTLSCIGDMAIGGLGAWLCITNKYFKEKIINLSKISIYLIYILFAVSFFFRDELLLGNLFLRVWERPLISGLILLIILEQCFSNHSFYKMSNFKTITNLGTITYGLYCLHFLIISFTVAVFGKFHLNESFLFVLIIVPAVSLTASILVSKLSYKYFESPFLRLKEKFSFRK